MKFDLVNYELKLEEILIPYSLLLIPMCLITIKSDSFVY